MTVIFIRKIKKLSKDYYQKNGIECLDIINDILNFWNLDIKAFYLGNAIKYEMRAPYKGDFEGDIDKAIDYLKMLKADNLHSKEKILELINQK